ncbi:MAG: aldehyde dehydrogenase family protein, partial [Putridiphycobacter sp.]|nr:aldehyde dehydrogenase family protein [Putridiphycobacter sp.]
KFDKIFFTGSVPVGRIVYQAAAKNLIPVTLELGGKSPAFVFADTDLKRTAQRLVWAKFLNAGQTCIAPDYIVVEKSIEGRFLQALKDEIALAYPQNTSSAENYVQIINQKNFERLVALIDKEKIYLGGDTDLKSRYIAPTVLNSVTFSDKIMEDEIFGPILPVIAFEDLDATIKIIKERPKPLSCYVYSKNNAIVNKIIQSISFGGGAINDSVMHISNSKLPFGGVGASGIGSYHGKAGFDTFTHYKSILHKKFWFEPSIKYAPYSNFKLKLIKWFMG